MPIFSRVSSVYRNSNAHVRKSGAYVPTYQVYVKGGGVRGFQYGNIPGQQEDGEHAPRVVGVGRRVGQ